MRKLLLAFAVAAMVVSAAGAEAQNFPAPKEGIWIARDFRFIATALQDGGRTLRRADPDPARNDPIRRKHAFNCFRR
jgi:hypothetical protein